MKYLLKNIRISGGTVQTPGQYQGQKYQWLQAELFNDEDIFANPSRLPRFYNMTDQVINMYKPYAKQDPKETVAEGQEPTLIVDEKALSEAIAKGECPDILHVNQVHRYNYPLDAPYARVYRRDVKDAKTGATLHKAGEFITGQQGEIVPVTELPLYLKKGRDNETNEWNWVEEPSIVARRLLERSYKRYVVKQPTATAPAAETTAPEAAPDATQAEIEAAKKLLAEQGV